MSITDEEILELERLLIIHGLENFDEYTSPNYKFLYESVNGQEWGKDENGMPVLVNGYSGCVLEGSSRCFSPNQKVITDIGEKRIKDIAIGDKVKSFNEETKEIEFRTVTDLHHLKNKKKCFRVKMKDGTIIEATEDHKFYYEGAWVTLKHLLSLYNDKKSKD